jgi:hypothetical protein
LGDARAGVFGDDRHVTFDDVKDGLAQTFAVIETGNKNGPFAFHGPGTVRGLDPDQKPYIGQGGQFGGLHRGDSRWGSAPLIANAAFLDASVRMLRETTQPHVMEALATIAGGEQVPADF